MQKFEHFISLGMFCGVAQELARLGLRDASYPLDWLISGSYADVYRLILNHFEGFLEYSVLYQSSTPPATQI